MAEREPSCEQLESCVAILREQVDALVAGIERAGLEGHPMLVDVLREVSDIDTSAVTRATADSAVSGRHLSGGES